MLSRNDRNPTPRSSNLVTTSIRCRSDRPNRSNRHTTSVSPGRNCPSTPSSCGRRSSTPDVIGTSPSSWEEAAVEAITTAGGSVRDIRVAEVTKQDIVVGDGGGLIYRTKIQLSFKYESE